jgi:5-methylcytosine-specific restriction endonuclease McrA
METIEAATAAEYKASLPKGRGGAAWTIDTFSVYVSMLYPHIHVVAGQSWAGANAKYTFLCSKHGDYKASAATVLNLNLGCQCRHCSIETNSGLAGVKRNHRATAKEKLKASELYKNCGNYNEVARIMGRSLSTVQRWINPEQAERSRQYTSKWRSENQDRSRAITRRYRTEFAHGIASDRTQSSIRRIRKSNTPEYVFLDNTWMEVDRAETYRVFKDELCPLMERVHIKQLYLEAQKLTEETGIEYEIDHIHPLSLGGEHLMINLQLLPKEDNRSKSNTFRLEDQAELCRRLFNPTHIQK